MGVVDMQNVISMEDDLVALMQSVKPGLVKWVVHDRFEELPITYCDLSPEIFTPAS